MTIKLQANPIQVQCPTCKAKQWSCCVRDLKPFWAWVVDLITNDSRHGNRGWHPTIKFCQARIDLSIKMTIRNFKAYSALSLQRIIDSTAEFEVEYLEDVSQAFSDGSAY